LREENKRVIFETRGLKKVFGPKREGNRRLKKVAY
jgi:hypothetical protein